MLDFSKTIVLSNSGKLLNSLRKKTFKRSPLIFQYVTLYHSIFGNDGFWTQIRHDTYNCIVPAIQNNKISHIIAI